MTLVALYTRIDYQRLTWMGTVLVSVGNKSVLSSVLKVGKNTQRHCDFDDVTWVFVYWAALPCYLQWSSLAVALTV